MENYFNYFTDIEEQFLRRRGGGLLLTTLDWALIETWKDAGIPLEAALRGIDAAFDRYDQRPSKTKKVNSLAYCSQEVLAAAEDMKEAAVGSSASSLAEDQPSPKSSAGQGFDPAMIAAFLRRNADRLCSAKLPHTSAISMQRVAENTADTLCQLAGEIETAKTTSRLEDLERHLTVLEEKLFAALLAAAPDEEIVAVRAQSDRELAPYRSKMAAAQIAQLQTQYAHKRLLEKYGLPRLSLFYM
ncbi:MAG: hypothetical protein WBV55_03990 [Candidatus Sulfotelmatobacter sp.]